MTLSVLPTTLADGKKLEGKERMRGMENNSFVWLERNRGEKKKKKKKKRGNWFPLKA